LGIGPEQQAGKHEHPKQRIFHHAERPLEDEIALAERVDFDADFEIGLAVAVDIALRDPVVEAQFPGGLAECVVANEFEFLIAAFLGVGVDAAKIDPVILIRAEISDLVAFRAFNAVLNRVEIEAVGTVIAGEDVPAGFAIEAILAVAPRSLSLPPPPFSTLFL
jgi:hypothetical protein